MCGFIGGGKVLPPVLKCPLRAATALSCRLSQRLPPRNEFQVTLVPMAPAHYRKMLPPMFANYDGDQKPSKFQRKQWKPTSENHFLLAFVIPLLTADLPVWRPRVSDPAGRSHIHCRFPSKKCVLCRSCCCPGWRRRERHYVMTKNNCLSLGFLTASLLCLSIL